jgi:hypothetical protein
MKEVQRFYRATWVDLLGTGTISFRADNMQLAWDHAEHCAGCLGVNKKILDVKFIGRQEPTGDFGVFVRA